MSGIPYISKEVIHVDVPSTSKNVFFFQGKMLVGDPWFISIVH
jgi:hypothetical protein